MNQPTQPLIFDHTAIIALFKQRGDVVHYWEQANEGQVRIVLPAGAVAEANRTLRGAWGTWEAVLFRNDRYPHAIVVQPLDEHSAVDAGLLGPVPIGHTLHEAKSVRGVVVTAEPDAYRGARYPLLLI